VILATRRTLVTTDPILGFRENPMTLLTAESQSRVAGSAARPSVTDQPEMRRRPGFWLAFLNALMRAMAAVTI
jgi:hypothetical protein